MTAQIETTKEDAVATYILTMRIEADSDVGTEQICNEIYLACADVPFSFDITGIRGGDPDA